MSHKSVQAHPLASETSIRQLLANGKSRPALDAAKEWHKGQGTAASESLLLEAYIARIQSLMRLGLTVEAKALAELVRERHPSARAALDDLAAVASARAGSLDELVRPLNDPSLPPERRSAIEETVAREVHDLGALAQCAALPADHPLRQAAAALNRCLLAVTNGPVEPDSLALPEVSRRSPLAPWKLLVRAIAALYRCDDQQCRECLDGIKPETPPARLVPPVRAMLGGPPPAPLTSAATALVSAVTGNPAALRKALESLDHAFTQERPAAMYAAMRPTVDACRQSAPAVLTRLKQHIYVRSETAGLEQKRVLQTLGGAPQMDACFYRLRAHAMEQTHEPDDLLDAIDCWDEFRQHAVREGWFPPNGAEAATLYLHMAATMRRLPREALHEVLKTVDLEGLSERGKDLYYLDPEKLYQRACALDPHWEAFSQWMEWAAGESRQKADRVAESWHKICPSDIVPILHLMDSYSRRNAFHSALQYLAKAEAIDAVHSKVRRARLRFLAGGALQHLVKKKFHLAAARIDEMAALPQARQANRPAFLAALRYIICLEGGDTEQAAALRDEMANLLGSAIAASLLIRAVSQAAKRVAIELPAEKLQKERALPVAMGRVAALAEDMQMQLNFPHDWMAQAARQFPSGGEQLEIDQLQALAAVALRAGHAALAYAISATGLSRDGAAAPRFLLLRAKSLPPDQFQRRAVCAATAAELARQQRDLEVVEQAVEVLREDARADLSLTPEQIADVVRRERAAPATLGGRGKIPDYGAFFADELCQCPRCRAARGETLPPDIFDEDEDEDDFDESELPSDMPPEIARMLFDETRRAVESGESLPALLDRLFGPRSRGGRSRKGRRA